MADAHGTARAEGRDELVEILAAKLWAERRQREWRETDGGQREAASFKGLEVLSEFSRPHPRSVYFPTCTPLHHD